MSQAIKIPRQFQWWSRGYNPDIFNAVNFAVIWRLDGAACSRSDKNLGRETSRSGNQNYRKVKCFAASAKQCLFPCRYRARRRREIQDSHRAALDSLVHPYDLCRTDVLNDGSIRSPGFSRRRGCSAGEIQGGVWSCMSSAVRLNWAHTSSNQVQFWVRSVLRTR